MAYSFNGSTKTITLSSGTTTMGVRDLWSRWVDWWLTSDNSKYLVAFEQVGGNDIDVGAGTSIPIYAFLQNGWKIKPQEANHTLNVNDGILLVSGGGDPFINTTGSYIVRINYSQPVQAITVATGSGGSGGLTTEQAEQLARVDTTTTTNLDKKVSEIGGGSGGGFVNLSGVTGSITNLGKKLEESKKEIIEKVESSKNEILDEKLDIQPIIDKIDSIEIPEVDLSQITTGIGTIKTQNTKLSQKLEVVKEGQEKIGKGVSKLADRQDMTDKMIESEADEIESELEEIFKQEAEMIESELESIYKAEADKIESELNS